MGFTTSPLCPSARRLAAIFAVAAALVCANDGRADIVACSGLDAHSKDYKILLDEITYIGNPDAPIDERVLEFAMKRLKGSLQMALQELQLQQDVQIKVVRCEKRKPEDSDFAPDLTETLGRRGVLVEVWGDVLSPEAAGTATCEAIVKYVLIPVRTRDGNAPAFHEAKYSSELTGAADRLLDLFAGTPELRAFAAIGAGLDRLAVKEYDLARKFLCRADGLLRVNRPADDALLVYVEGISRDVLKSARGDAGYAGLLKSPVIGACHAGG
jgi:hypothetical protein